MNRRGFLSALSAAAAGLVAAEREKTFFLPPLGRPLDLSDLFEREAYHHLQRRSASLVFAHMGNRQYDDAFAAGVGSTIAVRIPARFGGSR